MTLNPNDAATALDDIATVQRHTRDTLIYGRAAVFFILWGVLLAIGYVVSFVAPAFAETGWRAVIIAGFTSTAVLIYRRPAHAGRARWDRPMMFAQLALYGYGWLFMMLAWPLSPRQLDAYWPNVFMLGYVLAGLWLGRFFLILGLSVTALTAVGYVWSGAWFPLWMAVVGGGGLIAGGLWLRRQG